MSTPSVKYPRTYHFPWSLGLSDDDKAHSADQIRRMFLGKDVVITEKLDGENTTVYSDGRTHARSTDSKAHPARTWMRAFAAQVGPELPPGWRLVGENLYARHSIAYTHLPSYFVVFGVVDSNNIAQSWDTVTEWCSLLDCALAPVLWRGVWTDDMQRRLAAAAKAKPLGPSAYGPTCEGYVARLAGAFPMDQFTYCSAKFVRKGHVQTGDHWMHGPVVPNKLK